MRYSILEYVKKKILEMIAAKPALIGTKKLDILSNKIARDCI